jgi:hypothetical protein
MKSLNIERLDYKNALNGGGYSMLPSATDLNSITDINEVSKIYINFETEEEAIQFAKQFPKSYKANVSAVSSWKNDSFFTYYSASFSFNTFFHNDSTGSTNESAVNRRIKVIKKLQELI